MGKVLPALALIAQAALAQPGPGDRSIDQLLSSPAVLDKAWGVFWASRLVIPGLGTRLIDQLTSVDPNRAASFEREEKAYVDTVFDALILSGTLVPAQILAPFSPGWRDEALILLARQQGNEDLLLSMRGEELNHAQWLAVNNLLLRMRSAQFFATTLRELSINHTFEITDAGGPGYGAGGGGGGVGCGTRQLPRGFPPIGVYQLRDFGAEGDVLVVEGPQNVYYRRTVIPTNVQVGWSVSHVTFDGQKERLEYLAALNQVPFEEARRIFSATSMVRWRGPEEFAHAVDAALEAQIYAIQGFVAAAGQRGLGDLSGLGLAIAVKTEDHRRSGEPSPAGIPPRAFTIP